MASAPVAAELALAVFDNTADGILIIDRERNVRAMNKAAERILGQSGAEAVGRFNCAELDCRDEEGRPLLQTGCRCVRAFAGPPLPYFEMEILGEGGRRLPVAVSASALPENAFIEGEELVAIVMRDRRAKRELEQEVELKQRETEFLYSVSRHLAALTEFESGMEPVLEQVRIFAGVDLVGLLELEHEGDRLVYRSYSSAQAGLRLPTVVPVQETHYGEVVRGGIVQVIPDILEDRPPWEGADPLFGTEPVQGLVFLPLRAQGRVLGSLMLVSHRRREYAIHELAPLAAAAGQIAVALAHYRLFSRLRTEVQQERRRVAAAMGAGLQETLATMADQVEEALRAISDPRGAKAVLAALRQTVHQARRALQEVATEAEPPAK